MRVHAVTCASEIINICPPFNIVIMHINCFLYNFAIISYNQDVHSQHIPQFRVFPIRRVVSCTSTESPPQSLWAAPYSPAHSHSTSRKNAPTKNASSRDSSSTSSPFKRKIVRVVCGKSTNSPFPGSRSRVLNSQQSRRC